MRLRSAVSIVTLMAVLMFASAVWAQSPTTGQITGVVRDASGALVGGAKITLTSSAGVQRETASDSGGHYTFSLLPPGNYRVEAEKTGFSTATAENVVVQITQTTNLDIPLVVASQKAVIEVAAESPLVDTENPARGSVIDQQQIRQLPLPTRNFQQLLTLTTGTSGPIQNSSELGRGAAPIYVNGNRSTSNSVVINGADANSIGTGSTPNLAVPATDSLDEFIVQTSQYDASQGRVAGGIIAAVTKSGTNSFHGDLYEFFRNDALNANNWFLNNAGAPRPPYKRNQFGGTLGGPVIKDRLFFFLSYQGSREVNGTSLLNSIGTVFVPGDLSNDRSTAAIDALAASYSNVGLFTSCLPACLDPTALFLLQAKLPNGAYVIPSAPNPTTPVPGVASKTVPVPVVALSHFREDQLNTNLDFQLSTKNRLSAKFFGANNPALQGLFNLFGLTNPLPVPGFGGTANLNQRVLALDDTHILSSHLVNDARFGYSIITTGSQPQEPFTSAQLGITSPLSNLFAGMPEISVANEFDLGASPFADNSGIEKTYTVGDTFTWQKGRHSLKFGMEYKHHDLNETFNLYTRGQIFYLGFSGDPFADFLGGELDTAGLTIMGSGVNNRDVRAQDWSGFVNDDWRVTDRLTLTLGLRYEFFGPFTEAHGRFIGFDPSRLTTVAIPGGVAVTGGFVQASNASNPLPGVPEVQSSLVDPDKNNFAPRFGFAWRPRSDNRLVVRGGYGVYYDRANSRLLNNQILDFPYYTLAQAFLTPIPTPFVQVPQPSAFPLLFSNMSVFPFGGPPAILPRAPSPLFPVNVQEVSANGIYPDLHDFRTPYIQQFTFGMQNEFAHNWLLDLSYVGSAGRKEYRLVDQNQAVIETALGPVGPYYPGLSSLAVQGFGVHTMQSSSNSSYNSLQASLTKRFSHGLQFLASYTWSHSLDDYSGDATGTSDVTVVPGNQAPGQLKNYATSDFDRRNRFIFSGIYEMPKFYKGNSGFAREAINGWEVASVWAWQSGTPFSVVTNDTAFVQARADYVPGCNPVLSGSVESRVGEYFNVSCFKAATADAAGGFGNTGRNILQGPDQKNIDISLIKFFPITERTKLEFRSEFFNAFNNVSFANPVAPNTDYAVLAAPYVGKVLQTSTGPRVIQFALKLNF